MRPDYRNSDPENTFTKVNESKATSHSSGNNAPLLKAPTVGFGTPSYLKSGKGELVFP